MRLFPAWTVGTGGGCQLQHSLELLLAQSLGLEGGLWEAWLALGGGELKCWNQGGHTQAKGVWSNLL